MAKQLLKIGGGVIVFVILLLATLRATGFEPKGCATGRDGWTCRAPGLWLRGEVSKEPVSDWAFTDQYPSIKVQTRGWFGLPYSVTTWCVASDRELFLVTSYPGDVQFPHGRRWNENVARDPHVRLKVGDVLYERSVLHVTDPDVRTRVIAAQGKKYPTRALPFTQETQVMRVVD